jgi:hypothetical protein
VPVRTASVIVTLIGCGALFAMVGTGAQSVTPIEPQSGLSTSMSSAPHVLLTNHPPVVVAGLLRQRPVWQFVRVFIGGGGDGRRIEVARYPCHCASETFHEEAIRTDAGFVTVPVLMDHIPCPARAVPVNGPLPAACDQAFRVTVRGRDGGRGTVAFEGSIRNLSTAGGEPCQFIGADCDGRRRAVRP